MSDHDIAGRQGSTVRLFSHPPSLPATTQWHRLADRLLRGVYALGSVGFLAVILGGFLVASLLPGSIAIWLVGTLYLAVGGYCTINFWRCREAHCIVTGIGLTLLGVAVLAAALGAPTVISEQQTPILLGILVVAVAFEAIWRSRHGTNAVRRAGDATSRRAS